MNWLLFRPRTKEENIGKKRNQVSPTLQVDGMWLYFLWDLPQWVHLFVIPWYIGSQPATIGRGHYSTYLLNTFTYNRIKAKRFIWRPGTSVVAILAVYIEITVEPWFNPFSAWVPVTGSQVRLTTLLPIFAHSALISGPVDLERVLGVLRQVCCRHHVWHKLASCTDG
jgi:hypothetical protein